FRPRGTHPRHQRRFAPGGYFMASTTEAQGVPETSPWWSCLVKREVRYFLRRRARRHPDPAQLWQAREDWVQEAHRALVAAFPETHGPLQGQDEGPLLVVIRDGLREAWRAGGLGWERGKIPDWPTPDSLLDQEDFPRPWEGEPGREPDPADEAPLRE